MNEAENRMEQTEEVIEQNATAEEAGTQGSPDFQLDSETLKEIFGFSLPDNVSPEAMQGIAGMISKAIEEGTGSVSGTADEGDGIPVSEVIILDNESAGKPDKPQVALVKGPVDVSKFELGATLEAPSKEKLREESRGTLAKLVLILISWVNYYANVVMKYRHEIAELKAKLHKEGQTADELKQDNEVKREQAARERETVYGRKSERRSSLDETHSARNRESSSAEKDGTASQESGSDEKKGVETAQETPNESESMPSPEKAAEPQGQSAQTDSSASAEETASQKTPVNDESSSSSKQKERPKRGNGCNAKVYEGVPKIGVTKHVDQATLDDLAAQGHKVKHLPSGVYQELLYVTIPILVETTYERLEDVTTKEIISADSAHESKLLSGSLGSNELLSRLMFMRYNMCLSVPRILRDLRTDGLKLTKQTIYRWSIQYALALARPIVHRLLIKILESGKAQADETWVKIREDLAKEGRCNSILWLIRASEKLDIPKMVVVCYTGSRSAESLAKLIRGYAVKLMSDGYCAYTALLKEYADKLEVVACLQHARSKFVDVIQALKGKKEYQKLSEAQKKELEPNKILDLFADVFAKEDLLDSFETREEKLNHRIHVVKPALDELFKAIEKYETEPKAKIPGYWKTAIEYAVKFKDRFYKAVEDPDMPLHNTACERAFARFGILRRNFVQVDTVLGTEACVLWFSILETAEENGVNTQVYLLYLFKKLPDLLKAHGDYHWFQLKDVTDLDMLPDYGDLSYLDEVMPFSSDFKEFADQYDELRKQRVIWIAGKLDESSQSDPQAVANAA